MAESHTKGAEKGLFCSLREDTCPCGNKYQDILNGTESWGKYVQKHRVEIAIERSPEAHHVLPVASVTANVTANEKIRKEVVENTEWCVNDMANMIALPLFEMTFTHYLVDYEDEGASTPPPPFAGLPMHNYGHAAFQSEVNKELEKIAKDAQKNKQNHEKASETLLAALNEARDDFKSELESRGKRGKGTHVEFLNAIELGDSGAPKWYVPFSMAEKPEHRAFPAAPGKSGLAKKLKDLLKALKDWDSL